MTLDEAAKNIGRGVVYSPYPGAGFRYDGDIKSVNDTYVFVLYVGDRAAKATKPEDLEFLTP